MVTPQFLPVAGGEFKLEDITPVGGDTVDNINIKVLAAYGRTVDGCDYTWVDYVAAYPCWVDGDYNEVKDVSFTAGQGLWIYGSAADQGVQTVGKVGKDDVIVNLRKGAVGTGNPFPTAVALQDILAEGKDVVDNVNIKILDAYGHTVTGCDYTWVDYVSQDPCWVDGDYTIVDDVSFDPGQGLWVYGSSDAQTIRFPAPEL